MKRILISLIMLSFVCVSALAELPQNKHTNYPQGTFKKNKSGQIIQYDKNGKKLGVYKVTNKRYLKTK